MDADYPKRKRKSLQISAIAVAAFLAVFVVVGIWIYRRQRKARQATNSELYFDSTKQY